ncbi:zinc-dependent metalloprotease family protein [Roseomonas sp. AR75]|uniref:zinc-dependent metalloprotease family protein n=1 Tax=Roseomonas sp. AR75 TaxID=2562311 RepID=UPI0010C0D20E|nr:zinc-dependent metalloprotease family protein [Roseomonas sp. AR75]
MQQPGVLGQNSWDLADEEAQSEPSSLLTSFTAGKTLPETESSEPEAAGVTPPPVETETDDLAALFEGAGTAGGSASGATSGFVADAVVLSEAPLHTMGCACGACGMPSIEGAVGEEELGTTAPDAAVIDSTVTQGSVPTNGVGVSYGNTFKLSSLPTSKLTVYLDFDGFTTTGTTWNSYWGQSSFYSTAFSTDTSESFNSAELLRIQQIWARVAEYFSPFNINVTTKDPGTAALTYTGGSDDAYGIRVVVTDEGGKNFGGIAYKGSFVWSVDTPVFVYSNRLGDNVKSISDAIAHEVGHSLGLDHDGKGSTEYYYGHGSGATDWAPILGVGYNANIVQWSKGEYTGASNTQDDLSIITSRNVGVNYRTDDYGNSFSSAAALGGTVAGGIATVETFGVISGSGAQNDIDMFSFTVGANGAIDLTVSAYTRAYVSGSNTPVYTASPFSMLDVKLTLYNAAFQQVYVWNEASKIDGAVKLSGLAAGTYYLALDGVGVGDPTAATPTGYTEYGSLGQYMIRGTYSVADTTTDNGGSDGGTDTGTGTGTGDLTGGGTDGTGGTGGTGTKSLSVDRTSITTLEGTTETFTLRALGATGDVTVSIDGLNLSEGKLLTASQIVLSAANNWTAEIGVSGINDRDADGDATYSLQMTASGFGSQTVSITNADDDDSATGAGKVFGTYATRGGVSGQSIANQAADDGKVTSWREGIFSNGTAGTDIRWEFTGLTAGDKVVQVDAWSSAELFRVEYSTDDGATWKLFAGATTGALAWSGDFVATGVGTNLWVRLVDTVRTDTVADIISVDLLTVSDKVATSDDGGTGDSGGGGDSGDGGTGDSGGGGDTGGSGGGGTGVAALTLDRATLVTAEGSTGTVRVSATGATGDVLVTISGLDSDEGTLTATQLLLNAANNWSANLGVTGVEDRNVDGDASYTLQFSAAGMETRSLSVTTADDDVSATGAGKVFGTYASRGGVSGQSIANQAADDGKATSWRESVFADGKAGTDIRWEFTGLQAGDKLVQVDAWSANELFRLEYSTDDAASWKTFAGATAGSLNWNGDYLATGVGSNLWVRLVDTVRSDTTADIISVDLITVSSAADQIFA